MSCDLEAAARRLRLAFDLFEAGEELMRQNVRRAHPDLPAPEIEALLVQWLLPR